MTHGGIEVPGPSWLFPRSPAIKFLPSSWTFITLRPATRFPRDPMRALTFTKTLGTLSFLFASACGSSGKPAEKPVTTETKPEKSASTAVVASTSKAKGGLDAPDNDPALVALAREALKCFRKPECEARGKWYEPFHMGREVDFKTLVNLIEDDHPEIRSLAAGILRGKKGKPGFHTDRAQATRVLDALDREQDEDVAREIALAAAFIDVKATGLEERMTKVIHFDIRERVRVKMIESILNNNWDVPTVTAAVKGMTSDSSSDVRVAAVRAFDVLELRAEACPFWTSNLTHQDVYLADKCFYYLVSDSCKGEYEAMLSAAANRPPLSPENLQPLCGQTDTPEPVKTKLMALVEAWAPNAKLNGAQRVQSMKLLAACDPPRAKKTAAALTKDPDEYVRDTAKELDKSLPKK